MNGIYITDNNIAILEQTQKEWKMQLNQYGKLYLYSMSGFGKSENAKEFAEKHFSKWTSISAENEDFLERTEAYLKKNKGTKVRTLLILDDVQWVLKEKEQEKLVELLSNINKCNSKLQCLILSRAKLPNYLKPFYLTRQLVVEDKKKLWLSEEQIQQLLIKEKLHEIFKENDIKDIAKRCFVVTKGYPIGVCSIIRHLKEGNKDFESLVKLASEDIFEYFDRTLFVKWENWQKDAIIKLAVYKGFNIDMAEYILGQDAKEIIDGIMLISSFLNFRPPDMYNINPFFLRYLKSRQKNLSKEEFSILYYKAGKCYENMRELKQALHCYKEAGANEKIAELVISLSENVDGDFAKTSEEYLNCLPEEMDSRFPKLLGAKTLLFSYQMKVEESNRCLKKLKKIADEEKSSGKGSVALETYVRTLVALPHGTAEEERKKIRYFSRYMFKVGFHIKNIIPTGNIPSVINGGLDFISWTKNDRKIYPVMKKATEIVIGVEAVGLADVCMGENLYEKNKKTEAMGYLTKGLSDANFKGSIRVQYAAIGVMARLFQCEGQADTAEATLRNIRDTAEEGRYNELLPNILASLVHCALLKGDSGKVMEWLQNYAPNEHETFYITDRFKLFTKARVYVSIGRDMEALYILNILEQYTKLYNREYLNMEINLLKAVILFRRGEEWQTLFIQTVKTAASYSFVHIISDQGKVLLPLWQDIDWDSTKLKPTYIKTVTSELKKMAVLYPNYLKEIKEVEALSKKELEVIRLMSEGYTNGAIAKKLEISMATVKFHITNILKKLKADNRTMAVKIAQEKELL